MAKVVPRDRAMALGRREQSAQHLESGRLARAVGPQEAKDMPLRNREIHVVCGCETSEALGQPLGFDRRALAGRDGAIQFGELAGPLGSAAEDFDEPVLETWDGLRYLVSGPAPKAPALGTGWPSRTKQAHRTALDRFRR